MSRRILPWVLALIAIRSTLEDAQPYEERKIHRLIGGYVRNDHRDPHDDTILITASAGAGRESRQQKLEEDEKKTLAQQVADGKYGLIQKELFSKSIKRPGVISYESNSEVPKDNINNLGGLQKNEIWLAENHLLVLKGGAYGEHDDKRTESSSPAWPPLDDYKAPDRQVKIPAHPKVPPPFPVQLTDNGPLQILGTNSSRTLNGTFDASAYALPPSEGYVPGSGPFFPPLYSYPANITSGEAPFAIPPYPVAGPGDFNRGNGIRQPFPFPLNGTLPPYFASLPPGAAILPPPSNQTDLYDEDDPSIYYPPPYSFYYPKDNSTEVPPGPLVPGIILPPPPNFFAPLEEKTKRPSKSRGRKPTTTEPPRQIHPTTTPVPPTPIIDNAPRKTSDRINELKPIPTPPKVYTILPVRHKTTTAKTTTTTTATTTTTTEPALARTIKPFILPERRKKPPTVTILKPVKQTTTPPPKYYYTNNEVSSRPFAIYGPPPSARTAVSSTQIPLKAYYSTSNEVEVNSVTQEPRKQYYKNISPIQVPKTTTKPPAQYFFYEEDAVTNSVTTPRSVKPQTVPQIYNIPKEYYLPPKQNNHEHAVQIQAQRVPEQQYYYVTSNPYSTQRPKYRLVPQTKPDNFNVHIERLRQQLQSYLTTQKPYQQQQNNYNQHSSPRPVYQYSFQAANYKPQQNIRIPKIQEQENEQDKFRPLPKYSVQIQPAVEIISGGGRYQNTPTPLHPVNTERPASSKYYNTHRPDYEYDDEIEAPQKPSVTQKQQYVATPRPILQYSFEATPNPAYQQIYTKPEEGYFDDITKKYFTIFGKKLPGTTPIPPVQNIRQESPQYHQKPISLEGDTLVNYVHPRPPPNPNAEIVPLQNQQQNKYPQVATYIRQSVPYSQTVDNANYKQPRPASDGNRQLVQAISVPARNNNPEESPHGSFISYQLPGDDGAHFYFLTPQLAQRRDQGVGYYYSNPNASRVKRNNNNER